MQLHPDIEIILSTTADGSLRSSLAPEPEIHDQATATFLAKHDISPVQVVLLRLSYDTDDFCRYHEVTSGKAGAGFVRPQDVISDALVTRQSDIALFLPIADCIAAVLYHPPTRTLMLSHLGRHNFEQKGGTKSVEHLARFGVAPDELLVYLSPAADKTHYPLYGFENRSLHDVAAEQLMAVGVSRSNIAIDARDTVTDPDFFSHSAALRGGKQPGRHAVVCRLTAK